MQEEIKKCVDCKNFRRRFLREDRCRRPVGIDPVTGNPTARYDLNPWKERENPEGCGKEAKFYNPIIYYGCD